MKDLGADYIGVYDHVFSEDQCSEIINTFEKIHEISSFNKSDGTDQFHQGALGRKDSSLFFEQCCQPMGRAINEAIMGCFNQYSQDYLGLQGMRVFSQCVKVQRTPPKGGYHVWHSEHAGDIGSMRRAAVWILYLSTHEGSGETEFLQQGIRVAPQAGRVVIWPASYTHPHRGNPVYDKDKYIATGWFEHYYDVLNEAQRGE